jgi:hypothetical protein
VEEEAKKIEKDKAIEFLLTEYSECFGQIKHYDDVSDSYLKFATAGYPVIIGGISALYTILSADYRNIVSSLLLLLTFFAGVAILVILLTNRSYYVVVTRQINAVRWYFLENAKEIDFIKYNRAYVDSVKPYAYNPTSSSTWLFLIIAILNALVGAGFFYFLLYQFKIDVGIIWIVCVFFWAALLAGQAFGGKYYLLYKDRLHIKQTKKEQQEKEDNG